MYKQQSIEVIRGQNATISDRRKRRLREFESLCDVLGANRRVRIISRLALYGRSSVRDILLHAKGDERPSRSAIQYELDKMEAEGVLVKEGGEERSRGFYCLNPNNETVMLMTFGFREERRRRPEEETLEMVEEVITNRGKCSRAELYDNLKETGISQARLSQSIRKLIDKGSIEKWEKKGVGYSIPRARET